MKQVKIYAENAEQEALDQFNSALELECVTRAALMPDTHKGYTLPIGAAVESNGIIFPSWVGYDIGCGMSALPTMFSKKDVQANAEEIFNRIYKEVPMGTNNNTRNQKWDKHDKIDCTEELRKRFNKGRKKDDNGLKQLGSLGSGNHFIEIGYDEDNQVWIIIHSGSRGLGWQTARRYMMIAAGQNPDERGQAKEGHYGFDIESSTGKDYIKDLNFCLEFALQNRKTMIKNVEQIIYCIIGKRKGIWQNFINRNHNHAEDRGGDGRWIHRKGATHAESGMWGVIPGNMKDGSFIVKGKGNVESLYSSSHGAGRVLSRTKARKTLDLSKFEKEMTGITAKVQTSTLDESRSAYKDIFEVMRLQSDLVEVVTHVKPIINIKA